MNKPVSRHKVENAIAPISKFHRRYVLKALADFGYAIDFATNDITVLRNTDFPFSRITLPNRELISLELLKLYARDNGLDLQELYDKMINMK